VKPKEKRPTYWSPSVFTRSVNNSPENVKNPSPRKGAVYKIPTAENDPPNKSIESVSTINKPNTIQEPVATTRPTAKPVIIFLNMATRKPFARFKLIW
jgi:hypothetical protein